MRNLMRILSCLLTGILCAALLAGCSGSSADSEDSADGDGNTAAVAEEDANIEDETVTTSADYTTLTISTYDVDTSGNQELIKTEKYDADGNVLEVYEKVTSEEYGDYEYTISYSYNSDGLISEYTKEYLVSEEIYITGESAQYEYQYDEDGNLTEIQCTYTETYDEEDWLINYGAAGFRYNTEGNVTSAGIYITSSEGSSGSTVESENTIDRFNGLLADFAYYFDQITEISVYEGICSYSENYEYYVESHASYIASSCSLSSRFLDYSDSGRIIGIENDGENKNDFGIYVGDEYEIESYYAQLFYRVLEYIDMLQNTQMSPFSSYLLYGTYEADDSYWDYEKIRMDDYDSLGNMTAEYIYEDDELVLKYIYDYEYDEYRRVSAAYSSQYDEDGDLEETSVSYYEYE